MTTIAVALINYRQPQLTIATIRSLSQLKPHHLKLKIFLLDNNSSDNSVELFKSTFPDLKFYTSRRNLGFVGGNNFLLQKILPHHFDYVLVINNDVVVDPDFLFRLVTALKHQPQAGLAVPKIYFASGHEFHRSRYQSSELGHVIWAAGGQVDWPNCQPQNRGIDEVDHGQYDEPDSNLEFASGCCWLVPTSIFRQIGLLDNRYFMYFEDADFCQRLIKAGYHLLYVPTAVIWHVNSGSSSAQSPLHDYFLTRNRLLFGFTYCHWRTRFALLRQAINLYFHALSSWQKKAVVDFFVHKFGQGSWQ